MFFRKREDIIYCPDLFISQLDTHNTVSLTCLPFCHPPWSESVICLTWCHPLWLLGLGLTCMATCQSDYPPGRLLWMGYLAIWREHNLMLDMQNLPLDCPTREEAGHPQSPTICCSNIDMHKRVPSIQHAMLACHELSQTLQPKARQLWKNSLYCTWIETLNPAEK